MKDYLKAIILEQIERALCLKNFIHPVKYQELAGLAERCTSIIDSISQRLRYILKELGTRAQDDVRDILRAMRRCVRELEMVESHGISVLFYVNDDIRYMNKLIFRIHNEIDLPLPHPSVACICAPRAKYYSFHPFTNVIFVPVGESKFLLHLPDVFHELGHYVLFNMENTLRLKEMKSRYDEAIKRITDYYQNLLVRRIRETGPRQIPSLILHIHSQWKESWIDEFFCDLFALYTLGPAYPWAHLHLTIKKKEDVYKFSRKVSQTHPSDDSRMKILLIGLKKLGFNDEATSILSKWNNIAIVSNAQPIAEYQYAYPADLMEEIAELFLVGLREGKLPIISPKKLEKKNSNSIVNILNEAWTLFWNKPEEFRDWEKKCIKKLKSVE